MWTTSDITADSFGFHGCDPLDPFYNDMEDGADYEPSVTPDLPVLGSFALKEDGTPANQCF